MKNLFPLLNLMVPTISFAQQHSIDWYKITSSEISSELFALVYPS